MGKPFALSSRYKGACGACGEAYAVGDRILYDRDQRAVVGCGACAEVDALDLLQLDIMLDSSVQTYVPDQNEWTSVRANGVGEVQPKPGARKMPKTFSVSGFLGERITGIPYRVFGKWGKYGFESAYPLVPLVGPEHLGALVESVLGAAVGNELLANCGQKTLLSFLNGECVDELMNYGLSLDDAHKLTGVWSRIQGTKETLTWLLDSQIPPPIAGRALANFGADARSVLTSNPWSLTRTGASFGETDYVAKKLGIANVVTRQAEALRLGLEKFAEEGHVWTTRAGIGAFLQAKGLPYGPDDIDDAVEMAQRARSTRRRGQLRLEPADIIERDGQLALREIGTAEEEAATWLRHRVLMGAAPLEEKAGCWRNQHGKDITPSPEQREALRKALASPVSVITGPPGTGKSAALKAIFECFDHNFQSLSTVAIAARAARRVVELTKHPAITAARLLHQYKDSQEQGRVDIDIHTIDECSMVPATTFWKLLQAHRPDTRLVLVGDVDQLESIEAGNVLGDIIRSGVVEVTRLKHIFRTEAESKIPYVAQFINRGRPPPDAYIDQESDIRMVDCPDEGVLRKCVDGYEFLGERRYGIKREDTQIIAPMNVGPAGTRALNSEIQARFMCDRPANLQGFKGKFRTEIFPGDRVVHTENNTDLDVMNGEIGVVRDVNLDKGLTCRGAKQSQNGEGNRVVLVEFMDREPADKLVLYTKQEARDLDLGYALSVHKFQGSQAKLIIVPLIWAHKNMLNRSLLYTAITRAEQQVVLVGDRDLIGHAARRTGPRRRTRLAEFLEPLKNSLGFLQSAAEMHEASMDDGTEFVF